MNEKWVRWFCASKGNEFYVEVEEEFIHNSGNLTGLSTQVPLFKEALEIILDLESEEDEMYTKIPDISILNPHATMLYGLIHQRYITTHSGLLRMSEKYNCADFGRCPRVYCEGARVLPCGQHDLPAQSKVRLYCSNCKDLYSPASPMYNDIDGAHFGTTFPHLFVQTFSPPPPCVSQQHYVPRLFGFRVNETSHTGPRMAWLRQWSPEDATGPYKSPWIPHSIPLLEQQQQHQQQHRHNNT